MKKIPSLFMRDWDGDRSLVLDQINPEAQWVLAGRGLPYRKRDGTAVLVQDGFIYRRYDAKKGRKPPTGLIEADIPDPITGHWPGWIILDRGNPSDMWFFTTARPNVDGTYEFCGPMVNGNPEGLIWHQYIKHDSEPLELEIPLWDLGVLRMWLEQHPIEGIVWHEIEGDPSKKRYAKIKRKDLGLSWPLAIR